MKIKYLLPVMAMIFLSCNQIKMTNTEFQWPTDVNAPVAEKIQKELTIHGDTRIDNYYWMNDYFKKGPAADKVVNHLDEENAYTDSMMSSTKPFQETLFKEMKGRIKEKDESVPVFKNGYFYYVRFEDGKQYFKYCRKKGSLESAEEILLDVDAMAEGFGYFSATGFNISPDNKLMAYGIDTLSRRIYDVYIKNLETGEIYKDKIQGSTGSVAWANDNKTFFYTWKNEVTLLTEKIMKHRLGTASSSDKLVYQEKDPSNYIGVAKTKSEQFLLIASSATMSSEYRILDANKPDEQFKIFQPRIKDVLYDIEQWGDKFLVHTNKDAINFRLMETEIAKTGVENWKEVIPHREDVLLSGLEVFKDYWVISERKEGLIQLRVINKKAGNEHYLDFGEPAYQASVSGNPEFNSEVLRFNYTSLTTPSSVFDYGMSTKDKKLMKQQEVLGGYNAKEYVTERFYATAKDGTKVPISIVYKKGLKKDGKAPLLLYAYGSYGISMDASFSSNRLSLLDRGFVYAIAHIRGGQEMGRKWYEDGKLFKKINTFTDFIDCAEYLIEQKYTSKEHLYAMGGSAGGLLMGAIVNLRPDLWKGIVAAVPFVDVVTTMLDETIPLTTNEYDEWGNPNNKEAYTYMKSYSPYDNVEKKNYPNMLITTGLHDSQVQYFEPEKWVAKLREYKTDNNVILLHTNMKAGHGGASGRFDYLKDIALQYAFLFALEGKSK